MLKNCPVCRGDLENLGDTILPGENIIHSIEYYGCRYSRFHKYWHVKTESRFVKYFSLINNNIDYYITIDVKNKTSTLGINGRNYYTFDHIIDMDGNEQELIDRFEKYSILA